MDMSKVLKVGAFLLRLIVVITLIEVIVLLWIKYL